MPKASKKKDRDLFLIDGQFMKGRKGNVLMTLLHVVGCSACLATIFFFFVDRRVLNKRGRLSRK